MPFDSPETEQYCELMRQQRLAELSILKESTKRLKDVLLTEYGRKVVRTWNGYVMQNRIIKAAVIFLLLAANCFAQPSIVLTGCTNKTATLLIQTKLPQPLMLPPGKTVHFLWTGTNWIPVQIVTVQVTRDLKTWIPMHCCTNAQNSWVVKDTNGWPVAFYRCASEILFTNAP